MTTNVMTGTHSMLVTRKKMSSLQGGLCTNYLMLVQQSFHYAILFWQGDLSPSRTHRSALAAIGWECWSDTAGLLLFQVMRLASVKQGPVHTGRISDSIYCTGWFWPIFGQCVRCFSQICPSDHDVLWAVDTIIISRGSLRPGKFFSRVPQCWEGCERLL